MSAKENPVASGAACEANPAATAPQAGVEAQGETLQNVTQRDDSAAECLTVKQLKALDMLLHGEFDAAIAKMLDVSRMTLWRWQTHHAPFKAELARRRRLLWNTTADRYRRLLLKAAEVLEAELNNRYDMSRFRAANLVLRMAGRIAPAPDVEESDE